MNNQFNSGENPFEQTTKIEPVAQQPGNSLESNMQEQKPSPGQSRLIQHLKGIGIIGVFFLSQTVAGFVGVFIAMAALGADEVLNNSESVEVYEYLFAGMAIVDAIFIVVLIIIYRKAIVKAVFKIDQNILIRFFKFIGKIVMYFILYLITVTLFNVIDSALFPQFIEELGDNQEFIEDALLSAPSIALIFTICIGAPVIEEYVFRYGIMKRLLYGVNKYVAAVIAALIFSFIHIGFSQMSDMALFAHLMLGYLGQALVFSLVYAYEDNLLYPIALHLLGNSLSILFILGLA